MLLVGIEQRRTRIWAVIYDNERNIKQCVSLPRLQMTGFRHDSVARRQYSRVVYLPKYKEKGVCVKVPQYIFVGYFLDNTVLRLEALQIASQTSAIRFCPAVIIQRTISSGLPPFTFLVMLVRGLQDSAETGLQSAKWTELSGVVLCTVGWEWISIGMRPLRRRIMGRWSSVGRSPLRRRTAMGSWSLSSRTVPSRSQ